MVEPTRFLLIVSGHVVPGCHERTYVLMWSDSAVAPPPRPASVFPKATARPSKHPPVSCMETRRDGDMFT